MKTGWILCCCIVTMANAGVPENINNDMDLLRWLVAVPKYLNCDQRSFQAFLSRLDRRRLVEMISILEIEESMQWLLYSFLNYQLITKQLSSSERQMLKGNIKSIRGSANSSIERLAMVQQMPHYKESLIPFLASESLRGWEGLEKVVDYLLHRQYIADWTDQDFESQCQDTGVHHNIMNTLFVENRMQMLSGLLMDRALTRVVPERQEMVKKLLQKSRNAFFKGSERCSHLVRLSQSYVRSEHKRQEERIREIESSPKGETQKRVMLSILSKEGVQPSGILREMAARVHSLRDAQGQGVALSDSIASNRKRERDDALSSDGLHEERSSDSAQAKERESLSVRFEFRDY